MSGHPVRYTFPSPCPCSQGSQELSSSSGMSGNDQGCLGSQRLKTLLCFFSTVFPFLKSWNSGISEILLQLNKYQVLDGMQTREKKPSSLNSHVEPKAYTHTHTHTHTHFLVFSLRRNKRFCDIFVPNALNFYLFSSLQPVFLVLD